MVVPSLERRLVDDRLDELQRDGIEVAATYASQDFSQPLSIDQFVAAASILYNARTVVYQVFGPSPLSLRPLADSASSGAARDGRPRRAADGPHHADRSRTGRTRRPAVRAGRGAASPVGERPPPLVVDRGPARDRSRREAPAPLRDRESRCSSRRSWAAPPRRCTRVGSAGSSERRTGSRREGSTSLSSTTARTSSASSPLRSIGCASSSPSSTRRGRSSSRTRRTSCGRLCSRSAASSSSCRTRTSTRRPAPASSRRHASRSTRLTRLSADLLDLSRMDAGRLRVESEEVVLADVAPGARR